MKYVKEVQVILRRWMDGKRAGLLIATFGCILMLHGSVFINRAWAEDESLTASLKDESSGESDHGWQAPEEQADETRLVRYLLHFSYFENKGSTAQVNSMLDLSVRRKLDQTPFGAYGVVRFQKDFSSDDSVGAVDLREAKICYGVSRFQGTVGRFDLQPLVTPLSFFGAYPLMGVRRVDGAMATFPLFFKFGDKEDISGSSAPLAVGLIYSPSLLSAEIARMDKTQGFFMGQVRCRLGTDDQQVVLRVTGAKTRNSLFQYSSLSGDPAVSASAEWITHRFFALCGEWSIQNISMSNETGVVSGGLRFERLATVGSLSLDGIWLEGQAPIKGSLDNLFTGGNPFDPALAELPKFCWYARVKGRLGQIVWEIQATTNRNDFTLARATSGVLGSAMPQVLGPGRQGGDAELPLQSTTYKIPAYMLSVGMPF
jgi:hypothetical protein